MIPNPANLAALQHNQFALDSNLGTPFQKTAPDPGAREMGFSAELHVDGSGNGRLSRGTGTGVGLWTPYSEGQAVIAYVSGSQTWVASGPFSGCEFAVGKAADGRVFAAHIAKQSGSTAGEDFQAYLSKKKLTVWYWNRIPIPSETFYACTYVFAEFGGGGLTSMTRVNVRVTSMGGSDGSVFEVRKLKG